MSDIFDDAEGNFKNAEKTLKAFWNLIKKPFVFIFNWINNSFGNLFRGEDETTRDNLKKLPL
jgi:hypothetical protein